MSTTPNYTETYFQQSKQTPDPLEQLVSKLKGVQGAYVAADRTRRLAMAVAYDSGAMTLKQIAEALELTPHAVRSLIDGAAADALALLEL